MPFRTSEMPFRTSETPFRTSTGTKMDEYENECQRRAKVCNSKLISHGICADERGASQDVNRKYDISYQKQDVHCVAKIK